MPEPLIPAEAEDVYEPTLVELLAESIPTELTATAHVGIGSARRLKIAWAVLPVVEAAIEQARQEAAEHIAGLFAAMTEKYPEGIWPSESDALGAVAMRHAYGQAELIARAAFPKETNR